MNANTFRSEPGGKFHKADNNNDPNAAKPGEAYLNIFDWTSDRFMGEPDPVKELVKGVIELGIPAMAAAQGELGKSYSLLELSRRVAFGSSYLTPPIFGGSVVQEGTAVALVGEDDRGALHRRLAALDPKQAGRMAKGDKLITIPMPSAVAAIKPFWRVQNKGEYVATDEWHRFCDQLASIADLKCVVIDPLQLFATLPINEDPAAGQFVCGSVATLAAHTGATVFVAHHMSKNAKTITGLAEARDAIRGTTALVDGVCLAYSFWYGDQKKAREICKKLGIFYAPNRVVHGGVVKANGGANRILSTYVRNEAGLLVDHTHRLGSLAPAQADLMETLVIAIEAAAADSQPFTKTGANGLYTQRARLPEELQELGRDRLYGLAQEAEEKARIVGAMAKGSTSVKWLDVPGGPFARGEGEFRHGGAEKATKATRDKARNRRAKRAEGILSEKTAKRPEEGNTAEAGREPEGQEG